MTMPMHCKRARQGNGSHGVVSVFLLFGLSNKSILIATSLYANSAKTIFNANSRPVRTRPYGVERGSDLLAATATNKRLRQLLINQCIC